MGSTGLTVCLLLKHAVWFKGEGQADPSQSYFPEHVSFCLTDLMGVGTLAKKSKSQSFCP